MTKARNFILLILVALAAADLFFAARQTRPVLPGVIPDPTLQAEARFARARSALIRRGAKGAIGYWPAVPADRLGATPGGVERYFRAQFALAPLILEVDGKDRWIVADFDGAPPVGRMPAGWTIAEQCGGGVLLLQALP